MEKMKKYLPKIIMDVYYGSENQSYTFENVQQNTDLLEIKKNKVASIWIISQCIYLSIDCYIVRPIYNPRNYPMIMVIIFMILQACNNI
jgi:hypothetical protein